MIPTQQNSGIKKHILVQLVSKRQMLVHKIFEAYKKILSDDELKKEMVQKGLEQAKKFEWKKSVEMLEKIYEEI